MIKFIKHIISKLFFKYCFKESELVMNLIVYWVPSTMKQFDKNKIKEMNGKFLFAKLNQKLKNCNDDFYIPFEDIKIKEGIVEL